jgi:hypothetical protein
MLVVLVDPEQASGVVAEFFQVGANEPFDTDGLRFVGSIGNRRFIWAKNKRRPYFGEIEHSLQ